MTRPDDRDAAPASPRRNAFPIAPPARRGESRPAPTDPAAPDLHLAEIEERQIPKDRNIFDK